MPDTGPWGTRKAMWTESTMKNDGTFTGVTLKDIIDKARIAYLQLKDSPEYKDIGATRAFMTHKDERGGLTCGICGNMHKAQGRVLVKRRSRADANLGGGAALNPVMPARKP